jgi:hypothetical protein
MIDQLEEQHIAKFGHTYTVLKARQLDKLVYAKALTVALSSGVAVTDSLLGLYFPDSVNV